MKAWFRTLWSRALAMVKRDRLDRDFDDELTTHLELLIDESRQRGLSNDARREALRKLGRPTVLREVHREQRGMPVLDMLMQDLRYAVRMLWKSPAFTGTVTPSLALGIGANTALFSLVDNLLLRSMPVRDPDRLVQAQFAPVIGGGFKKPWPAFDKPVFDSVRRDPDLFDVVGFQRLDRPLIVVDGGIEPTRGRAGLDELLRRPRGGADPWPGAGGIRRQRRDPQRPLVAGAIRQQPERHWPRGDG